jgi:hypothetical protein
MNWNLLTGFAVVFLLIAAVYLYHAPHREAAFKRVVLMLMVGLIGFWQIYLLG